MLVRLGLIIVIGKFRVIILMSKSTLLCFTYHRSAFVLWKDRYGLVVVARFIELLHLLREGYCAMARVILYCNWTLMDKLFFILLLLNVGLKAE